MPLTSFKHRHALFTLFLLVVFAAAAWGADPGLAFPANSEVSDQKTGSVLFYNYYTSGAVNPATHNTRFTITNTNLTAFVAVHLFFVASNCQPSDFYIALTPNQTATFLASDLDPGVAGYLVAVATDISTGIPLGFNYLSGSAQIKLPAGHEASLPAEAFSAQFTGLVPGGDINSPTAVLNFDGAMYNRAPSMLAIDKLRSLADGNNTMLVLNRFGGNLLTGASTIGTISGVLYDDLSNPNTFAIGVGGCQSVLTFSNTFPPITPNYSSVIPAGRTGWMKFYSPSNVGILGAVLNFNANTAGSSSAFTGGHNLRKLLFAPSSQLLVPVFPF